MFLCVMRRGLRRAYRRVLDACAGSAVRHTRAGAGSSEAESEPRTHTHTRTFARVSRARHKHERAHIRIT